MADARPAGASARACQAAGDPRTARLLAGHLPWIAPIDRPCTPGPRPACLGHSRLRPLHAGGAVCNPGPVHGLHSSSQEGRTVRPSHLCRHIAIATTPAAASSPAGLRQRRRRLRQKDKPGPSPPSWNSPQKQKDPGSPRPQAPPASTGAGQQRLLRRSPPSLADGNESGGVLRQGRRRSKGDQVQVQRQVGAKVGWAASMRYVRT